MAHLPSLLVFIETGLQQQSSLILVSLITAPQKAINLLCPPGNNTFFFINQQIRAVTHSFHFSALYDQMRNNSLLTELA